MHSFYVAGLNSVSYTLVSFCCSTEDFSEALNWLGHLQEMLGAASVRGTSVCLNSPSGAKFPNIIQVWPLTDTIKI